MKLIKKADKPKPSPYWNDQKFGRPKKFSPRTLWKSCLLYFQWCKENPWIKNELIRSGDHAGTICEIPTERPFTKSGLCVFLKIDTQTWANYDRAGSDFFGITTRVNNIVYTQKFEGAAVGAFDSRIIARDLGLRENMDLTSDGQKIEPITEIITVHTTEDEYKSKMKALPPNNDTGS